MSTSNIVQDIIDHYAPHTRPPTATDRMRRYMLDMERKHDALYAQFRVFDNMLDSPAMRMYREHVEYMERLERFLPPRSEPELFTMPSYTPPQPTVNVSVTLNVNFVGHEDTADDA